MRNGVTVGLEVGQTTIDTRTLGRTNEVNRSGGKFGDPNASNVVLDKCVTLSYDVTRGHKCLTL